MLTLRPYQQQAVQATLAHFRQRNESAVIVLPTGAGKSLVIAELARLARYPVLVLTHVRELVEQNHARLCALGVNAGVFSAGLQRRDQHQQGYSAICASIQSLARNLEQFSQPCSLIIIDECHRVGHGSDSQYQQVMAHLHQLNPRVRVLGLTATPYRLGEGWIYRHDYRGFVRESEHPPFSHCIYELPLSQLIREGYLTPPRLVDAAVHHYDFSALQPAADGHFPSQDLNRLLQRHPRVTRAICEEIETLATTRKGVMIFAATVEHAKEICSYLPAAESALITATTPSLQRTELIQAFREQRLKFIVNVAVLTTGFDVAHVDLIAILRPTESVSLFQQIAGRGLRLASGKNECLIIDYAGNGFNLFHPEVGSPRPDSDAVPVQVFCPACGFANTFWGHQDSDGRVIEHFGRRCQGVQAEHQCDYRFRFKSCPACGRENDIAARRCHHCEQQLIDPDDLLRRALNLKDAQILRCAGMTFSGEDGQLRVLYHGEQGETLSERFDFSRTGPRRAFARLFTRSQDGQPLPTHPNLDEVVALALRYRHPDFVIARRPSGKNRKYRIEVRLFDYQGRYRTAHSLA